jgi:FemAB-related protein (PEP-CTERM system-associated)
MKTENTTMKGTGAGGTSLSVSVTLSPCHRVTLSSARELTLRVYEPRDLPAQLPRLEEYAARGDRVPLSRHPSWLAVLAHGLGHRPYCLEAMEDGKTRGIVALASVRSWLFGRFLVGLPYLNTGGVLADDEETADLLVGGAVALADRLGVRYLELRHERPARHPALGTRMTSKVHMRLELPDTPSQLWDRLSAKVRNQVRKGQKNQLTVVWGGEDLLAEFYHVFCHNMRDLGTPVYGRRLFAAILQHFPGRAELCVIRGGGRPVAGALLLHGRRVTEVPSASSLRRYNPTCANMLLYWHLLERAVQRGQHVFDFGRSTVDGNTYRFKKQWGAAPAAAEWQYYVRKGGAGDLRPENPRYRRFVRLWQRLPVALTRVLGPRIVRGIP